MQLYRFFFQAHVSVNNSTATKRHSGIISQLELESKIYQHAPGQLCQNILVLMNDIEKNLFNSSSSESEIKLLTNSKLVYLQQMQ